VVYELETGTAQKALFDLTAVMTGLHVTYQSDEN